MYGRVSGISLLWMIGLTSILMNATRREKHTYVSRDRLRHILCELAQHMRYAPTSWSVVCADTFYDIRKVYKSTVLCVSNEILSCVVIPYFLIFKLPHVLLKSLHFLQDNLQEDRNWGHFCTLSEHNNIELTQTTNSDDAVSPIELNNSAIDDALITAYIEGDAYDYQLARSNTVGGRESHEMMRHQSSCLPPTT